MAWFETKNVNIAGIATAVPAQKIDARGFCENFSEEEVEKFIKSTGIHSIYKSLEEQTASDLGYAAADYLLNKLQIDRSKIGILVFITMSPDYRRPATSCVLQMRLGLPKTCAALDSSHGCSGFVYGHQIMESMLAASDSEYGLLVLGETPSKVMSIHDRTSMMMGDAGSAILYRKQEGVKHSSLLCTDGESFKAIIMPAGGFRDINPPEVEMLCSDETVRSNYNLFMNGLAVFTFAIREVPKAISEYLQRTQTRIGDYDRYVFHQANSLIIRQIVKKIRADENKVPMSLDRYGNTDSSSIPLTICDCYGNCSGRRERILASGFGVGLSWGVVSFELDADTVFPVIETDLCYREGKISIDTL